MVCSSQIVVNSKFLALSHEPEDVFHRDTEQATLLSNIHNQINTVIIGPCGSGKSTLAKHVFHHIEGSHIVKAFVDCSIYRTTYSILKEIIPSSTFVFSRSNYELIKELIKYSKKDKFLVSLDNFHQLKDMNLIGRLMSLGVCIVLISDNHDSYNLLNENIRQNIPSCIQLSSYTVDQTFDILQDRAALALVNGSCSDAVLTTIASRTKGNMALAINALKTAALRAERNNKHVIDESDISVPNDLSMKLNHDEEAIIRVLREKKSLPSRQAYRFYTQKVRHPKGTRSFRNYMELLCSKGLVKAIGEKRGRIYELIEATC